MNVCTAEGETAIEKGGNDLKRKKKRIFPPEKEFIATRERETILDLTLIPVALLSYWLPTCSSKWPLSRPPGCHRSMQVRLRSGVGVSLPGPRPGRRQVEHAHMLRRSPRCRRRQPVNTAQAGRPTWGGGPLLPGRHNGGEEVGATAVGSRGRSGGQQAMLVS
jgi:hypothetical protein